MSGSTLESELFSCVMPCYKYRAMHIDSGNLDGECLVFVVVSGLLISVLHLHCDEARTYIIIYVLVKADSYLLLC